MVRKTFGVAALLLLGCAGALGPDRKALENVADALVQAPTELAPRLLVAGLSEPGVNLVPKACAEGLNASTVAAPDQRTAILTQALPSCPIDCKKSDLETVLREVAAAPPGQGAAMVAALCGYDKIFGEGLGPLLRRMEGMDYLVQKSLLAKVDKALGKDPLAARYEELTVKAALGGAMAGAGALPWPRDPLAVEMATSLDARSTKKALEAHAEAIRACAGSKDIPAEARAEVALVFDATGALREVEPLRGDKVLAGCAVTELAGVTVTAPVDARPATVVLTITAGDVGEG